MLKKVKYKLRDTPREQAVIITVKELKRVRHQKRNLTSRLIAITLSDHYGTIVSDSKGHKSRLPTQERMMQDQSDAILWMTGKIVYESEAMRERNRKCGALKRRGFYDYRQESKEDMLS